MLIREMYRSVDARVLIVADARDVVEEEAEGETNFYRARLDRGGHAVRVQQPAGAHLGRGRQTRLGGGTFPRSLRPYTSTSSAVFKYSSAGSGV